MVAVVFRQLNSYENDTSNTIYHITIQLLYYNDVVFDVCRMCVYSREEPQRLSILYSYVPQTRYIRHAVCGGHSRRNTSVDWYNIIIIIWNNYAIDHTTRYRTELRTVATSVISFLFQWLNCRVIYEFTTSSTTFSILY